MFYNDSCLYLWVGRRVPLCMCRSQDDWQGSLLPPFCVEPGNLTSSACQTWQEVSLPTKVAHPSGGMNQSRAVHLRPDMEEVERLGPCVPLRMGSQCLPALFPGQSTAPCYDALTAFSQAVVLSADFPQALCYSDGQLNNSVSMIPCLQSRAGQ